MSFQIQSPAEQVAAHLREEILRGRWVEEMPGVAHLQNELGVNHVTINAALRLLEQQDLLISRGRRRRRAINRTDLSRDRSTVRIRLLHYDQEDRFHPCNLAILAHLHESGFEAKFTRKSLHEDLGMNLSRVEKFVSNHDADVWIISGGSQEILTWFAERNKPAIAVFGSFYEVPIAGIGVRKSQCLVSLINDLTELNHQRIVLLSHRQRLTPKPAVFERIFLKTMASYGIQTGTYNLPIWEPSNSGLQRCLDELFQHTPPTALIVDEAKHLIATYSYLCRNRIRVPEDLSLICADPDPSFTWCTPQISHMQWSKINLVNRVVRWTVQVANGRVDKKQILINAKLVKGSSIGPAKSNDNKR